MLGEALEAGLATGDFPVRQLVHGPKARRVDARCFEADLSSTESLSELQALFDAEPDRPPIGALINLLPLSPAFADTDLHDDQGERLPLYLFNTLRQFGDEIASTAEAGAGVVLNLTSMGGRFGVGVDQDVPPAHAASVGFMKTLAQEIPAITVKNIDLDPQLPPEAVFGHVLMELASDAPDLEVGIGADGRQRLGIREAPLDTATLGRLPIDRDSVVLITGGARGVTARVAIGLAEASGCRLVLVGRSELPGAEPAETVGLGVAELRARLIEEARASGGKVSPASIEANVRGVLRDREILGNLEAIGRRSAGVEYHACDVRDDESFGELIADLYGRLGRIDGVIHGAGLIEDKLIRDKSAESYQRVMATKVRSANTLASRLDPQTLRFLVFFASVSGRFGNVGQSDYSAANEYLSKLASRLDRTWNGRVLSVGWGPWDGGMITDELRRLYQSQGVNPMPADAGVAALLDELRLPDGAPEILLGCDVQAVAAMANRRRNRT